MWLLPRDTRESRRGRNPGCVCCPGCVCGYGMRANVVVAAGCAGKLARTQSGMCMRSRNARDHGMRAENAHGDAAGDSRPRAGMTTEPSDAETCLHVSASEANKSSPVRGMTCKARQ